MSTQLGSGFNVMEYGAVGDGVADDSAAIQATIDAATVNTPPAGTVVFPSGEYLCLTGLTTDAAEALGLRFVGLGGQSLSEAPGLQGASLIAGTNAMTLLRINSTTVLVQAGPLIQNINFRDESPANTATLLHIHNTNRWTLRNCTFRNASGAGGVGLDLTREAAGDNSWNMIYQCNFNVLDVGIRTTLGCNFTMLGGVFNVSGTWSCNFDDGSTKTKIFGTEFIDHGILLEGEHTSVIGCAFENCNPSIRINDTGNSRGRRNQIIANTIVADFADVGIDLAGTNPEGNQLIANTFSGIGTTTQIVYGGGDNIILGAGNGVVIEVNAALALTWRESVVNVTSYGGTRVITLPDANLYAGKGYLIRREGTNTVTINVVGADVFGPGPGDTQVTLDSNSAAIGLISIGDAQWKIMGTEGTVGSS